MRHPWLVITVMFAGTVGCVSRAAYEEKVQELQEKNAQLRQVSDIAQKYGAQVDALEKEKAELAKKNQILERSNEDLGKQIAQLNAELQEKAKSGPDLGPVDVVATPNGYAYRIEGDFLFDPGKANLKPSAKQQLADIAEQLLRNDYRIEVAGHTDSDPVKVTKKLYPRGNIELGAARALRVWEQLVKLGVPKERLYVSSYGEHEPVDPVDKSKNRRVEIRVIMAEPTRQ